MVKAQTAYTEEIDDVEAAVSSILQQLKPEKNLLKNSAALVHCYYEFIESGVIEELSKQLGIPIIGTTTMALGVHGYIGDMGLSVTVLTSDDARFSLGISDPVVSNDISGAVADVYKKISAGFDSKPALIFTFPPLLKGEGQGGDAFVLELERVSGGGIPLFGTLPYTNNPGGKMSSVIYMGKEYTSSIALLALYGDVKPEFYTAAITENALRAKRAKITGTKFNIIESIDNIPVGKYLEDIGIAASSMSYIPVVIYPGDGSKIFWATQKVLDDGSLLLSGMVPENAEVSFASISDDDVLESTAKLMEDIIKSKDGAQKCILIYACASRFWILGSKWMDEPGKSALFIKDTAPWHFVYSGGEVFPSISNDGITANRLQNYSVVACVL
ncbi:MAG: FIST C-terminal domain-containing protein [Spirochaetaceae bacterium]|jgi:hypothetical protein|nr:FIST C-terminal domain-containing protein [Spirochaetaceae bacterium]